MEGMLAASHEDEHMSNIVDSSRRRGMPRSSWSEQTARVFAIGLALTLVAWAEGARADPSVVIRSPTATLYGDNVPIEAFVTSGVALKGVRAALENVALDLVSPSTSVWTGTMDVTPIARGSRTLTVTATDVNDAIGTASVTLNVDRPPKISVAAPLDGRVVRPSFPVEVTCVDDDPAGCTSVRAVIDGSILAAGSASLSTNATPPAHTEGRSIVVDLVGVDSAGQSVTQKRTLYVENSSGLAEIQRVPGKLLDFSATDLLYRNEAENALLIRSRATSMDVVVAGALTEPIETAALYQGTVVYQKRDGTVVHWKGSDNSVTLGRAVVQTGGLIASTAFKLAGPFVAFRSIVDAKGGTRPVRHHLDTGAMLTLTGDPDYNSGPGAPSFCLWLDLAANGDVVYNPEVPRTAFLYREATGQYEPLVHPSTSANTLFETPVTNGESVVFAFAGTVCDTAPCSTVHHGIGLFTPGTGIAELAKAGLASPGVPRALRDFQFGGSWVAFTRSSAAARPVQVWTRSPAGVETERSTAAAHAGIAAVSSDGEIVFDVEGARFRSSGTSLAPKQVGSSQGKVIHRDDHFHVLLGDSLFRVTLPPEPDGGTSDASDLDAPSPVDATNDAEVMDTGPDDVSSDGAGGSTGTGGAGGADAGIADGRDAADVRGDGGDLIPIPKGGCECNLRSVQGKTPPWEAIVVAALVAVSRRRPRARRHASR
jgi:hypothetical protein